MFLGSIFLPCFQLLSLQPVLRPKVQLHRVCIVSLESCSLSSVLCLQGRLFPWCAPLLRGLQDGKVVFLTYGNGACAVCSHSPFHRLYLLGPSDYSCFRAQSSNSVFLATSMRAAIKDSLLKVCSIFIYLVNNLKLLVQSHTYLNLKISVIG